MMHSSTNKWYARPWSQLPVAFQRADFRSQRRLRSEAAENQCVVGDDVSEAVLPPGRAIKILPTDRLSACGGIFRCQKVLLADELVGDVAAFARQGLGAPHWRDAPKQVAFLANRLQHHRRVVRKRTLYSGFDQDRDSAREDKSAAVKKPSVTGEIRRHWITSSLLLTTR